MINSGRSTSRLVDDVPSRFLNVGGDKLIAAWRQWRERTPVNVPDEEFVTLTAVSMNSGQGEILIGAPHVSADAFTLKGDVFTAPIGTRICVAGALDEELLAHTAEGRTVRASLALGVPLPQRLPPALLVAVPRINDAWESIACADHARALVDAAIMRENTIARPAGWPRGVPVIAGPAAVVAL